MLGIIISYAVGVADGTRAEESKLVIKGLSVETGIDPHKKPTAGFAFTISSSPTTTHSDFSIFLQYFPFDFRLPPYLILFNI